MGRYLLGVVFVGAGILHFVLPRVYLGIMPPGLPHPLGLVYFSGLMEVLGGIGVIIPFSRRFAAWGLVALLIAVWPANLFMAMHPEKFPGIPVWSLWARLPLQLPLIWWAWIYTR